MNRRLLKAWLSSSLVKSRASAWHTFEGEKRQSPTLSYFLISERPLGNRLNNSSMVFSIIFLATIQDCSNRFAACLSQSFHTTLNFLYLWSEVCPGALQTVFSEEKDICLEGPKWKPTSDFSYHEWSFRTVDFLVPTGWSWWLWRWLSSWS